jgi:hypothetical protein
LKKKKTKYINIDSKITQTPHILQTVYESYTYRPQKETHISDYTLHIHKEHKPERKTISNKG